MNIRDYLNYKDSVINIFETRGFDGITEFSSLVGVPLVYCYSFVQQYSTDKDVVEYCILKIKNLKAFYGEGIF